MRQSPALTDPSKLAILVEALEVRAKKTPIPPDLGLLVGLVRRAQDDPSQKIAVAVADEPATSNAYKRWMRENENALKTWCRVAKVVRCTVIFAGNTPPNPDRRRLGATGVRMISAVHYLWVDQLRILNEGGD